MDLMTFAITNHRREPFSWQEQFYRILSNSPKVQFFLFPASIMKASWPQRTPKATKCGNKLPPKKRKSGNKFPHSKFAFPTSVR
jgi:hypothetical protein